MELGQFSVSLAVKDIEKSFGFYKDLGFTRLQECGGIAEKWLILKKGDLTIGLFQDMLEGNVFTFNPTDVRSIQAQLKAKGHTFKTEASGDSGPSHCILKDPDGNTIMFDQHV